MSTTIWILGFVAAVVLAVVVIRQQARVRRDRREQVRKTPEAPMHRTEGRE